MEAGLSHIVLDSDPAPPKGHTSIVAKRSPISATAELLFHLSKMAAVCHLEFVLRVFGHSRTAFGSLYHCVKFGWNRCSSFDNMEVLIFYQFGLKMPIHAPKVGGQSQKGGAGSHLIHCRLGGCLPPYQWTALQTVAQKPMTPNGNAFLWPPYVIGQAIIFALWFLLLSIFFFPLQISAVADWMSTTLTYGVALVRI